MWGLPTVWALGSLFSQPALSKNRLHFSEGWVKIISSNILPDLVQGSDVLITLRTDATVSYLSYIIGFV